MVYDIVFGTRHGQVPCVFHDDNRASAGIGPNGEYNCFTCGAKAHNEIGFTRKYFNVTIQKAQQIVSKLERIRNYEFTKNTIDAEQLEFLKKQGINEETIRKHFFKAGSGKLMYHHTWRGVTTGYTWFNSPDLTTYNASQPKYKYDGNIVAGMATPYDVVQTYPTLIICEGEKDMLTAQSFGIKNAVAKIGGAITPLITGINFDNKNIILIYDCDDAGKEGAHKDAQRLMTEHAAIVKVIDLGLGHKEDLNDYFMKYNKTTKDLYDLIKSTPVFVPQKQSDVEIKLKHYVSTLTQEELNTLKNILKENTNGN